MNRQAGFTLIELLLVVLLLGLMASLSMPVISNFGSNHLNTAARRLAGTVKYLYNEAAMSGVEYRLVFELKDDTYNAAKLSPGGEWIPLSGLGAKKRLPSGVHFIAIYQPRHGEQNTGEVSTALLPGGWLEETIVHLQDDKDRKLTLRLAPLTGLTEIYDGYRDFK